MVPSDGALTLTTPGTIIFDPRTFTPSLDPDGDNVYHFTTINIAAGVTVRLLGPELNMHPVFWLASGAVQIDGTIDLNGQQGHEGCTAASLPSCPVGLDRFSSEPGAGGYPGGVGGTGIFSAQPGSGPGGGGAASGTAAAGGSAGHANAGVTGGALFGGTGPGGQGGAVYGNVFLVPLIGGSGGGGGNSSGQSGSGGGAGGGSLLIASSTSITIGGTIMAKGGNSGKVFTTNSTAGGPGSGGGIHLLAPLINGAGTLDARGGVRQSGAGDGSPGRIRLEAFQREFTGIANPVPSLATPFTVFLPNNLPSVRVVAIEGKGMPEVPSGSFAAPDITINQPAEAVVMVEARNVPAGTLVQVHVFSENGPDQIIDSTPLEQQPSDALTAMTNVVFPTGFSRIFVRAKWTNP